MITVTDKRECCGCGACVQRCPKHCLSMREDEEGFLYPVADASLCIECGLCERVCPVINQGEAREPMQAFAAKNPDESVRQQSSSGGIFTLLAERVIGEGGVVFGAGWNEQWEVVHLHTESKEGLSAFRGSKYVQSRTGDSFRQAEQFLKAGRLVLYSGTPCQVRGLKLYLRKEYENLLTVDFICHGAPSPGVFRWYLSEELRNVAHQGDKNSVLLSPIHSIPERNVCPQSIEIKDIRFRDKGKGWKKYSFALFLSKATAAGEKNTVSLSYTLDKHVFMRGFLHDLYLRPSCHACPAKSLRSGADITLGDFWGIGTLLPEMDDDRGVSCVTVNTDKGNESFSRIVSETKEADYADIIVRNPALVRSAAVSSKRTAFFANDGRTFHEKIRRLCRPTPRQTIIRMLAFTGLLSLLKRIRTILRMTQAFK